VGAEPVWFGAYGIPTRYREVVLTVSKFGIRMSLIRRHNEKAQTGK
jgi:hypothetical protein